MTEKKEKACPLSPSEWIQCLIADQNQANYYFHSKAVLTLTKLIIQLTIIAITISSLALAFNSYEFPMWAKLVGFTVVVILIFYVMVWKIKDYTDNLSDLKKEMDHIKDEEDSIIEDIIDGKLRNSNEIRNRYKKI